MVTKTTYRTVFNGIDRNWDTLDAARNYAVDRASLKFPNGETRPVELWRVDAVRLGTISAKEFPNAVQGSVDDTASKFADADAATLSIIDEGQVAS